MQYYILYPILATTAGNISKYIVPKARTHKRGVALPLLAILLGKKQRKQVIQALQSTTISTISSSFNSRKLYAYTNPQHLDSTRQAFYIRPSDKFPVSYFP
ncbi:hypothetical protein ANAPH1_00719 [Anaplasma phagocytophilum]|nr:hypothetical protein ANAPH2_00383 [Anaplasma phagocytophilum]SCV64992.1 hypothetical protein ANAPH1_00719 [Anaplasma phagocytophilum]